MPVTQLEFLDPLRLFAALESQPFAHLLTEGARATAGAAPSWALAAGATGGGKDAYSETGQSKTGRSTLVAFPHKTLIVDRGRVLEDGHLISQDPFARLKDIMRARARSRMQGQDRRYPDIRDSGVEDFGGQDFSAPEYTAQNCNIMAGFHTGAIGHIGYEMTSWLEPQLTLPPNPTSLPDMAFGFYDASLCFDVRNKTLFLHELYDGAGRQLHEVLRAPLAKSRRPGHCLSVTPQSSRTQRDYEKNVEACKEAILDGEMFQANLSRSLFIQINNTTPPAQEFFASRIKNSNAGLAACLQYETGVVLSNSPERFFSVYKEGDAAKIVAEPIKGTRPRAHDKMQDRMNAQALQDDIKENAENIMIVDLVRNDLSRICTDDSVTVEKLCELQSFTNVHHLVSRISGILKKEMTAIDAVMTSFPCGSITGAPKLRAMEIIAEQEGEGRGAYCGAIGYIDDTGAATFSVAIRTAIFDQAQQRLSYRTGGGITLLSDPYKEYKETIDKSRDFF